MTVFVENETSILYEARFMSDHVLVKILIPDSIGIAPEKLELMEFGKRFSEYWGNPDDLLASQEDGSAVSQGEADTPPDRTLTVT